MNPGIVHTAGEDALARFVDHHLHLAVVCGLDVGTRDEPDRTPAVAIRFLPVVTMRAPKKPSATSATAPTGLASVGIENQL